MILVDYCVPRRYMRLLETWGYVAVLMTEYIAPDSPDADVIALAQRLNAVLLTVDLDFANVLSYPPEQYAGIIVMRYHVQDEAQIDETLKSALADLYPEQLHGTLLIISPGRYRLRTS